MALPSVTMPDSFPGWVLSHGLAYGSPFAEVAASTGHARKRRVSTGAVQTLRAQALLTPAEAAAFDLWYETELVAGTERFAGPAQGPDGALQWWAMRFAEPPAETPVATADGSAAWQVTATLRLEGEPEASPP